VSAAPDGEPCSLLGVDMHSDGNGQKSLHAMYSGCGGKPFQVRSTALLVPVAAAAAAAAETRVMQQLKCSSS
jgi:hypothetical protein